MHSTYTKQHSARKKKCRKGMLGKMWTAEPTGLRRAFCSSASTHGRANDAFALTRTTGWGLGRLHDRFSGLPPLSMPSSGATADVLMAVVVVGCDATAHPFRLVESQVALQRETVSAIWPSPLRPCRVRRQRWTEAVT